MHILTWKEGCLMFFWLFLLHMQVVLNWHDWLALSIVCARDRFIYFAQLNMTSVFQISQHGTHGNWYTAATVSQPLQRCKFLAYPILCPTQINQLEADLQELGSLLEKAERKRVQELLKQEQKKVQKELTTKRQQKEQQAKREADPSAASKAGYTVKITSYGMELFFTKTTVGTYSQFWKCLEGLKKYYSHFCISSAAWDQSEKFVKIYLDLKDVQKIPPENVEVSFTER